MLQPPWIGKQEQEEIFSIATYSDNQSQLTHMYSLQKHWVIKMCY